MPATPDPAPAPVPPQAVFRVSPLVALAALAFTVCATPVAFAAPFLWLVYLAPLTMIVWTVRVRTTADPDALTVRRIVGSRRVPWTQVSSLRLGDRARVSAVLTDGAEVIGSASMTQRGHPYLRRRADALAGDSGGRAATSTRLHAAHDLSGQVVGILTPRGQVSVKG